MEDLILDLMNASVATVWNKKIISKKELLLSCSLCCVDMWVVLLGLDRPGSCNPLLSE